MGHTVAGPFGGQPVGGGGSFTCQADLQYGSQKSYRLKKRSCKLKFAFRVRVHSVVQISVVLKIIIAWAI